MKTGKAVVLLFVCLAICLIVGSVSSMSDAGSGPRDIEAEVVARTIAMLHDRTSVLEDNAKVHAQALLVQQQKIVAIESAVVTLWKLHNDPNFGHYDPNEAKDANEVSE